MAEQDQDKPHEASPHKLREAQKRGQVAKSGDAVFVALLAALILVFYASGPDIIRQTLKLSQHTFHQMGRADWSPEGMAAWLLLGVMDIGLILAPLLLAVVIALVAANLAQVGGIFSVEPLGPDFNKLNPAQGLKRLFSTRALFEACKSLLKLGVLGLVTWLALVPLQPLLTRLHFVDPLGHGTVVLGMVGPFLFKLLLALLVLALLDIGFTRWDFAKKMRMSHRDMEDEHKQREGDPRIRNRLRQLRNEFLQQSRAMARVPEADVLITNPTHLAVALSYRHGEMPAPKLLAKGSGAMAAKMRIVARRHNIPVVENPPLARALYKDTAHEHYVPEALFPTVARIMFWVYARRAARQQLTARFA